MKELWDALISSIENGNYLSAGVVIVVSIIFNAQSIYNFVTSIQKKKAKFIEKALQSGNISDDLKSFMNSELDCEYFRQLTGIKTDKSTVNNLTKLYAIADGTISFDKIKTALPHLISENGFEVYIPKSAYVLRVVNYILFATIFMLGVLILAIPKITSLFSFFSSVSLSIFLFAFAAYIFKRTFSIKYAKQIDKLMDDEMKRGFLTLRRPPPVKR